MKIKLYLNLLIIIQLISSCETNKSSSEGGKSCVSRKVIAKLSSAADYNEFLIDTNCDTINETQIRNRKVFRIFKYRNGKLFEFSEKMGKGSLNQWRIYKNNQKIDLDKSDYVDYVMVKDSILLNVNSKAKYDSLMIVPLYGQLQKKNFYEYTKFALMKEKGQQLKFKSIKKTNDYLIIPYNNIGNNEVEVKFYLMKIDGPICKSKFWNESW